MNPDDIYVIAVNAGEIQFAGPEMRPPHRIAKVLYGIGHEIVRLAVETRQIVGHSYEQRFVVAKASGSPVNSALFLSPDAGDVSAVLYSRASARCADPTSPDRKEPLVGADFVTVHNLHGTVRLPSRWLPFGAEYEPDAEHQELVLTTSIDAGEKP